MCGEKRPASKLQIQTLGSPPHVRGKDEKRQLFETCNRITPAYAGKSGSHNAGVLYAWDHPRVCGEKEGTTSEIKTRIGITPAYAGKSRACARGLTRARDHPRVCGEKRGMMVQTPFFQGSPPRMRGKVGCARNRDVIAGITPAYAGKRSFCPCLQRPSWDHPRVCGEKRRFLT